MPTLPLRLQPLRHKVEFLHDGDLLEAEASEPLALSLLAAGRVALSRSPKWHRPRGPYCLRAACEGCLMRVDGVPNVLACQYAMLGGETVETQNVLGTRQLDLLQATDFLFPQGMDHHRLFAGVTGISPIVQRLARRIAGLGRLPDTSGQVRALPPLSTEVLIVGGGGAGLAVAAEKGPGAWLVEDSAELGGILRLIAPEQAHSLLRAAEGSGCKLQLATTAAAVQALPDGRFAILLVSAAGAQLVHATELVLATGVHEAVPPFAGGDLPGCFSARAGLLALSKGVRPGARVVVIGDGELARTAAAQLGAALAAHLRDEATVTALTGTARVAGVKLSAGGSVPADAVLYDAEAAPAFELYVQAGGSVRFDPARGYVPQADQQHRTNARVYCVGRVTGAALSAR